MSTFTTDKTLETLAIDLINTYHPHLRTLNIGYVFKDKAAVNPDGVVTAGMATKVNGPNYELHRHDAIIIIGQDFWSTLEPRFQTAVMDHELTHLVTTSDPDNPGELVRDKNGRIKLRIKKHDVQEFNSIMRRHGAYHEALRDFMEAFAQSKLSADKTAQLAANRDQGQNDLLGLPDPVLSPVAPTAPPLDVTS